MTQEHPLEPIRRQITELDRALLQLLARRRELSLEVARTKADVTKPVRDAERESALLTRLVAEGRALGLDGQYVSRLFHVIIEDSVLRQQAWFQAQHNADAPAQTRVAFLGARGSYSHLACQSYFERRDLALQELGQPSFDAIISTVEQGKADYGILPVENTSSGSINEVFDLLQHTHLQIVGETTESIPHCVLLPAGTEMAEVTQIFAHSQVHTQCSRYLATLNKPQTYCASSAEAMERAASTPNSAALGSERGGALYGLKVYQREIANQPINETRFLIVARKGVEVPPQVPAKTTLLMATGQKPGALVEALQVLRDNGINMTKLESRPIHGNPWEEMFYLDVAANVQHDRMQLALRQLTRLTRFIKVLGCYPSETILPTELDSQALAADPRLSDQPALHSRKHKPVGTEIPLGHQSLGGGNFLIMAGPADGPPGDLSLCARTLKEYGGAALWGGWHSRDAALDPLFELGTELNLPVIVSLEEPAQAQEYAHGDLWLLPPERMNQTKWLATAGASQHPVILCRQPGASLDALLKAAEQILDGGNQQVILCEPGRLEGELPVLDLAAVAWLKQHSHLPVLVAPQLPGDGGNMAMPLLQAARSAGADGALLSLDSSLGVDQLPTLMSQFYR
ncbi:chorismate mutase [Ferrimonas gelatinilytica]|uniref:Chorismate mutase n=1 Tax=Ferrimonas gelatinilytica TaxID=1255257 RepID=A0ABP9S7J6_9GAMM